MVFLDIVLPNVCSLTSTQATFVMLADECQSPCLIGHDCAVKATQKIKYEIQINVNKKVISYLYVSLFLLEKKIIF